MNSVSRLIFGLLCLIGPTLTAQATAYTWQGTATAAAPTSGSWNTAADWVGSAIPTSATTTELDFSAGSSSYTATDNIASPPFLLNIIGLSGTGGTVNIAGTQLEFVSNGATTPVITISGTSGTVISNAIDMGGTTLTVQGTTTGALNLSGVLSDGSLTVNDATTTGITLSNTNTYAGGTIVTGGLITSATGALGTGTTISLGTSKWTINTVAQTYSQAISLTGNSTIDGEFTATLTGTIGLGGNTLTLRDLNTGGAARSISNVISGTGSLVKNDAGGSTSYWVLSGNNTYSGTTTVNQGELAITGTTSGQGNYTVGSLSSISGTLSGNGTIGLAAGKTATIGNSATVEAFLAPTDSTGASSTIGTLTFNWAGANAANAVNIGSASNLGELFLNIGAAGSSSEIVVGSAGVAGAFNINGTHSTLSLNGLTGAFDGSTYVIANYFGTEAGTFGTLIVNGTTQASPTTFVANGYTYNVDYGVADAVSGSDIELVAAPEPSVTLLLGVGLLGFGLFRGVRRRESSVTI